MTVRCKFKCESKTEYLNGGENLYSYSFSAVTSGSPENEQFWKWTPGGTLKVDTVRNGTFEVGKEYYLDLTLAS